MAFFFEFMSSTKLHFISQSPNSSLQDKLSATIPSTRLSFSMSFFQKCLFWFPTLPWVSLLHTTKALAFFLCVTLFILKTLSISVSLTNLECPWRWGCCVLCITKIPALAQSLAINILWIDSWVFRQEAGLEKVHLCIYIDYNLRSCDTVRKSWQ